MTQDNQTYNQERARQAFVEKAALAVLPASMQNLMALELHHGNVQLMHALALEGLDIYHHAARQAKLYAEALADELGI